MTDLFGHDHILRGLALTPKHIVVAKTMSCVCGGDNGVWLVASSCCGRVLHFLGSTGN